MRQSTATLPVLALIAIVAAARPAWAAPLDTGHEAELAAMEELYQTARTQRFRDGDELRELKARAEAFIAVQDGSIPPATLATARTYLIRCRLTDKAYEEVFAEASPLLETDDLDDNDRAKLLFYRGVSAVETDRRQAATACVEALQALKPEVAAGLLGLVSQKWPLVVPGEAPPAWTLPRIPVGDRGTGKAPLSLSDLRGRYVLLDFWATWCGPCRRVMQKELAPLHEQWADDDRFELVSVGTNWNKDTAKKQAEFADKNNYRWTMVFDADGGATSSYGVRGIPTLTFIGPDGKVIAHGYSNEVMPKVKETLARLRDADASS